MGDTTTGQGHWGHRTVNLDTLTPHEYARLPRHIQANIPAETLIRLRDDLNREWDDYVNDYHALELREVGPIDHDVQAILAERYGLREPITVDDDAQTVKATLRVRVSPPSPINESLHRKNRGHLGPNPTTACPNTRSIGLRGADGALMTMTVHCKTRSCPTCGPHWAALLTEDIDYRIDEADGPFTAVTVTRDQRETWRKAVARARRRGVTIDGVSLPIDLDGTHIILLATDHTICASIPAVLVEHPKEWVEIALHRAAGVAEEWDSIPSKHRPGKLGNVAGLGAWKGNLQPFTGTTPEGDHEVAYEFVALPPRDELAKMAREAGCYTRKLPGDGLEIRERHPGAEQRLIAKLMVIDRRYDPPPF